MHCERNEYNIKLYETHIQKRKSNSGRTWLLAIANKMGKKNCNAMKIKWNGVCRDTLAQSGAIKAYFIVESLRTLYSLSLAMSFHSLRYISELWIRVDEENRMWRERKKMNVRKNINYAKSSMLFVWTVYECHLCIAANNMYEHKHIFSEHTKFTATIIRIQLQIFGGRKKTCSKPIIQRRTRKKQKRNVWKKQKIQWKTNRKLRKAQRKQYEKAGENEKE